jgi:hypothetical protein
MQIKSSVHIYHFIICYIVTFAELSTWSAICVIRERTEYEQNDMLAD